MATVGLLCYRNYETAQNWFLTMNRDLLFNPKARALTFALSDNASIVIKSPWPLQSLISGLFYSKIAIFLYRKHYPTFQLSEWYYSETIVKGLVPALEQALKGNFTLDKSIKKDIGYIWNERLRKARESCKRRAQAGKKFVYRKRKPWPGTRHRLFSLMDNPLRCIDTWLYAKDDKILLEVTPRHETFFPEYVRYQETYKAFIKNYEPITIIEISKERADAMLTILQQLIDLTKDNKCKYPDHLQF